MYPYSDGPYGPRYISEPFLRNFFAYEKHVGFTPSSSSSSLQDLVMDFQRLLYTNHEFENRTFVWVRLIFFLFDELTSFDWVRLKFSSVGFDLLCRASLTLFHGMKRRKLPLSKTSVAIVRNSRITSI